jgi:hypothetical protein
VTALQTWRVTIALAGLVVFGYGIRNDNWTVRWVGIGCLVVALVLRFVRTSRPR